jgi:hypothetical protein
MATHLISLTHAKYKDVRQSDSHKSAVKKAIEVVVGIKQRCLGLQVRFYLFLIVYGLYAAFVFYLLEGGFAHCGRRSGWRASILYFVYIVRCLYYLQQKSNPVSFAPLVVCE